MTIQIDRYISYAEIEAYATGILQKYGRQYKPITAPPVPIEDIIDLVVDIPIVREAIPDHQPLAYSLFPQRPISRHDFCHYEPAQRVIHGRHHT